MIRRPQGGSSAASHAKRVRFHLKVSGCVAGVHPAGRRATDDHEPRQVRKEAAISDAGCVADRFRVAMVQATHPETLWPSPTAGLFPFLP